MARMRQSRESLLQQIANGLHTGDIPLVLAVELAAPGVLECAWAEEEQPALWASDVHSEILVHTRPAALFVALRRLSHMLVHRPSDDLYAAEEFQQAGDVTAAWHSVKIVTRGLARIGDDDRGDGDGDVRIVRSLRACGPPTLSESVDAATRQAERVARGLH
jgi:hypothetical protein